IAAAMVGVSRDGVKCSTFADCKDALAAGDNIDYDGASGAIDFLDVGEPGTGIYEVYEYNAAGVQEVIDELVFESDAAPTQAAPAAEPEKEEERTASDVGITADSIKIGVVVSDLQGLIDIGYPLPGALSTDHLSERFTKYFDEWNAAGGINGRTVEGVQITWDPLSPASMEESCTKAVLDEQVFMAINASGFSQAFLPCFTEDNDTTFFYGEVAPQLMIDAAPNRLFALNPPSEIAGDAGAKLIVSQGIIPSGSKVGILDSNNPAIEAAGTAAKAVLEGAGYSTTTITVNTLSGDNAAANAEGAAAVAQFNAEGVDHVFVIIPFIYASGFWGEVGTLQPTWDRTILDSASSNCTPFGASRTNAAAENAICVTSYDSYATPTGGVGDDDAFEAQCREEWLDHFPIFNGKSDKGAPSGEVGLETADGELLNSDYAPGECTMQYVIKEALENAGVNPTRDSFADAMRGVSGPQAFRSNGEGAFGPGKNYFSTQMQAVTFTLASRSTAKGADGTFNGCPAPVNCWVPVTGEWFKFE
ncbi:MAG: ABC transporter substrate-binding protein, partial [Acidimicrobiales bacterium]|nr:ABC transporter substrate-binding protein [Acidimicrobiales bacterium]